MGPGDGDARHEIVASVSIQESTLAGSWEVKGGRVGEKSGRLLNLILASDRLERLEILLTIRINHLPFNHSPADSDTITFEDFLAQSELNDSALFQIIKPRGEAAEAVEDIRANFRNLTAEKGGKLPLPTFYNADQSLALLSYGLARHLKPEFALETGVGYGITSALVLLAMERNHAGELVSIDLPPLSDPDGSCTGLAVPEHLKKGWSLHLASSWRSLPTILSSVGTVGLFISDSADVYTLQRCELETVFPKLAVGGGALVNNIGSKFQAFLRSAQRIQCHSMWQVDKPGNATGLILKT